MARMSKHWQECANDFTGFTIEPVKEVMKKNCDYGKEGWLGKVQTVDLEEIQDLIDTTPTESPERDLKDLPKTDAISDE